MQPRNISFKSSSFPGLMSDVMFSLSLCDTLFLSNQNFYGNSICKTPTVYNSSRGILWKDSKSFFLYVFILYERSYSVCGKERVGTACIYMSSVIHRENLGGYLGLIMPFDSFFDMRADTALMKGCGLGMRSRCRK